VHQAGHVLEPAAKVEALAVWPGGSVSMVVTMSVSHRLYCSRRFFLVRMNQTMLGVGASGRACGVDGLLSSSHVVLADLENDLSLVVTSLYDKFSSVPKELFSPIGTRDTL
jgi:hypothetical protein